MSKFSSADGLGKEKPRKKDFNFFFFTWYDCIYAEYLACGHNQWTIKQHRTVKREEGEKPGISLSLWICYRIAYLQSCYMRLSVFLHTFYWIFLFLKQKVHKWHIVYVKPIKKWFHWGHTTYQLFYMHYLIFTTTLGGSYLISI